MPSHGGNLYFAVVAGFGAGLFWFFKGFRIYREYRVLADTPETPIRSIPMGLVEIHGKATGEQTVPSPVTRTSCFFYKVDIERWVRDKNGGHWTHAATDADGVRFYLEDRSGKVLIDARGAEYDLIQTAKCQTGGGSNLSVGRLFQNSAPAPANSPVSDQDLLNYVGSVVSRAHTAITFDGGSLLAGLAGGSVGPVLGSGHRYRLTEYCIVPDHWYDVTGTCVENPNPRDEHDRNMVVKGQNEPTFLISWRGEKEIESTLRNRAALHIFGGAALSIACLAILLAKFGWLP